MRRDDEGMGSVESLGRVVGLRWFLADGFTLRGQILRTMDGPRIRRLPVQGWRVGNNLPRGDLHLLHKV